MQFFIFDMKGAGGERFLMTSLPIKQLEHTWSDRNVVKSGRRSIRTDGMKLIVLHMTFR